MDDQHDTPSPDHAPGADDAPSSDAPPAGATPYSVSASRRIEAPAEVLFAVVADPTMHAAIDGSGSVRGTRAPARPLALGDRFRTSMRIGLPYVISNTVVELEPDRRIAWSHAGGWRWRWEFEPDGDATVVTETFDWSTAVGGPVGRAYVERAGFPARNARNMERSLERLEAYVTHTGQLS
jgi:hypothetical protein